MKTPRWALILTSVAVAGSVVFVVSLPPGSAAVSGPGLTRIELSARGDAMYFEGNSGYIPASPTNDASSLHTVAQLTSTGGGNATASTPYFGSTVQNLPGTANGVPPQFGLDVGFPFTRLPGYITCRGSGEESEEFGYGRVAVKCDQDSAEAHGSQGAPSEVPAPNQQETAEAVTRFTEDGTSFAEASGTVKGFVAGPLEVGSAIATATVRHNPGKQPEITSSTSGTFSVSGQQFGFTENGITFTGEGMSQDDALQEANQVLEAAGLRIEIAPEMKHFDEVSGQTSYTIGGLKITWLQEDSELVYILCRASITTVNELLGASPMLLADSAAQPSETTHTGTGEIQPDDRAGLAPGTASDNVSKPIESGSTSPPLQGLSLTAPPLTSPSASGAVSRFAATPTSPTATPTLEAAPPPAPQAATPASQSTGPMTLGFAPTAGTGGTGNDTEWLYLMIILGGIAVFGGQTALSRLTSSRG